MDWSVLFIGPPGAGKTGAIAAVSDIEVASTEAACSERLAPGKSHTTVAMDVGALSLGEGEQLRLVGAPGQPRFDFMWDILLPPAAGVVVLLDLSRPDPAADLAYYVGQVREREGALRKPMVIGVTHTDVAGPVPVLMQRAAWAGDCRCNECRPPMLEVDARDPRDVQVLLLTLTAMLEMANRIPGRHTK
jgi:uncharacterized protein